MSTANTAWLTDLGLDDAAIRAAVLALDPVTDDTKYERCPQTGCRCQALFDQGFTSAWSFLNCYDLCIIETVCKHWQRIVKMKGGVLWRSLMLSHYKASHDQVVATRKRSKRKKKHDGQPVRIPWRKVYFFGQQEWINHAQPDARADAVATLLVDRRSREESFQELAEHVCRVPELLIRLTPQFLRCLSLLTQRERHELLSLMPVGAVFSWLTETCGGAAPKSRGEFMEELGNANFDFIGAVVMRLSPEHVTAIDWTSALVGLVKNEQYRVLRGLLFEHRLPVTNDLIDRLVFSCGVQQCGKGATTNLLVVHFDRSLQSQRGNCFSETRRAHPGHRTCKSLWTRSGCCHQSFITARSCWMFWLRTVSSPVAGCVHACLSMRSLV